MMKWQNRERKNKKKRSQKRMGKPFKREYFKDSMNEKQISRYKKQIQKVVRETEEEDFENNA